MPSRGIFVTVEGGEGVGKSTNVALLEEIFCAQGVEVVVTREPGGTLLGEDIRGLLLQDRVDSVDPMTELLLIFAARAQHIKELIEPALNAGKFVLCDRFTDATYAYQSAGRGIDSAAIESLEGLVQKALRPNYTLLLDAPVSVGMARAYNRGELDRFERETLDFFERVRASYLDLARTNAQRFYVIDAGDSLDNVQRNVHLFANQVVSLWRAREASP